MEAARKPRAGLTWSSGGGAGTGHACLLLPKPQVPSLAFSPLPTHTTLPYTSAYRAPEPGASPVGRQLRSLCHRRTRLSFAPGWGPNRSNSRVPPHQLPTVRGPRRQVSRAWPLNLQQPGLPVTWGLVRTVLPPGPFTSPALLPSLQLFTLSPSTLTLSHFAIQIDGAFSVC